MARLAFPVSIFSVLAIASACGGSDQKKDAGLSSSADSQASRALDWNFNADANTATAEFGVESEVRSEQGAATVVQNTASGEQAAPETQAFGLLDSPPVTIAVAGGQITVRISCTKLIPDTQLNPEIVKLHNNDVAWNLHRVYFAGVKKSGDLLLRDGDYCQASQATIAASPGMTFAQLKSAASQVTIRFRNDLRFRLDVIDRARLGTASGAVKYAPMASSSSISTTHGYVDLVLGYTQYGKSLPSSVESSWAPMSFVIPFSRSTPIGSGKDPNRL